MGVYGNMWTVASILWSPCFYNARTFYRLKSTNLRSIIHSTFQDCMYKTSNCTIPSVPHISRLHLSQSVNSDKDGSTTSSTKKPKKPKEIKTFITLMGVDKSMYVTTVEDATKLAERRNYKLVKVSDLDTKSGRAVYQLMTESEFLKFGDDDGSKTNKEKDSSIKGEKIISLNSSISENDVKTKIKMMKKWISKLLQVKVIITGDTSLGEKVYNIIEKEIGPDGRVVKNKAKGGVIRIVISPPKKAKEATTT